MVRLWSSSEDPQLLSTMAARPAESLGMTYYVLLELEKEERVGSRPYFLPWDLQYRGEVIVLQSGHIPDYRFSGLSQGGFPFGYFSEDWNAFLGSH